MAEYKVEKIIKEFGAKATEKIHKACVDALTAELTKHLSMMAKKIKSDIGTVGLKDNEDALISWVRFNVLKNHPKQIVELVLENVKPAISGEPAPKAEKKAAATVEEEAEEEEAGEEKDKDDIKKELGNFLVKYSKIPSAEDPPSWLHKDWKKYWKQYMNETGNRVAKHFKSNPGMAWGACIGQFRNWMAKHYGVAAKKSVDGKPGTLSKPLGNRKLKKIAEGLEKWLEIDSILRFAETEILANLLIERETKKVAGDKLPNKDNPPAFMQNKLLALWPKFWAKHGAEISKGPKEQQWGHAIGWFRNWLKKYYGVKDVTVPVRRKLKKIARDLKMSVNLD